MSASTDELVRAMADPLRRQIVELLAKEQLCTCGLVEAEPAGRYTYYRLRPEALASFADTLTELAAQARDAAQTRRPCP